MGRFSVELHISNAQDVANSESGFIPEHKIRRATISGLVDTGATRLVLPDSVVTQLGLPKAGRVSVRYADGRAAERDVAGFVKIEIQGRSGVFSAVIEPNRSDALVGAIVLEELDFIADCITGSLIPRDPKQPIAEIE